MLTNYKDLASVLYYLLYMYLYLTLHFIFNFPYKNYIFHKLRSTALQLIAVGKP